MISKIKHHYYWVIALVMILEMTVYGGIINNYSLFLLPISQSLQISRGTLSLAFSLRACASFLAALFTGLLLQRYGYRKMTPVSIAVLISGLLLIACSNHMATVSIGFILAGLCNDFCLTCGSTYIVRNWFRKHYGLIMGLVSAATGLGGGLFSLLFSKITPSFGWRASFVFSAVCIGVIAVLILLFIRNKPQDLQLPIYGEGEFSKKEQRPDMNWPGFPTEHLKTSHSFYLLIVLSFLTCLCFYMPFYVISPHMQDCGMSAQQAAVLQSICLFVLAGAKFVMGFLSDRIGPKKVTLLCVTCGLLGLFLFARTSGFMTGCAGVILLACALPCTCLTITLLTQRLFGTRAMGAVLGIVLSSVQAASIIANALVNNLYDLLGSYRPVFWGAIVVVLLCLLLYLVLYAMAEKEKQKYETAKSAT